MWKEEAVPSTFRYLIPNQVMAVFVNLTECRATLEENSENAHEGFSWLGKLRWKDLAWMWVKFPHIYNEKKAFT